MNAYNVLIFLCGLVIFSYLFDLFAKRTRIPSVLLLLVLGMGLRLIADHFAFKLFDIQQLLPALGTVGLILIVFEGALDLTYESSKRIFIRKAFVGALVLLLVTTAAIAAILETVTAAPPHACIANAIPLSVISSAVAIPSASGLLPQQKEFVTYESSFSDILGIILFNFIVTNDSFGAGAFGHLSMEIIAVLLLSAVFSMALLWTLGRIKHHVKFFLILSILVLVYAVGKQFHLSSLVVVLAFGIFLANADQFPSAWFKAKFLYPDFVRDMEQFHSLSRESAFLIRTFFFVLFGYGVDRMQLADQDTAILCGLLLVVTYLLRGVFLKLALGMDLRPLVYMSPRGLISILLYVSLPPDLQIPSVGMGLLFMLVIATCSVMALGLMGNKLRPLEAEATP